MSFAFVNEMDHFNGSIVEATRRLSTIWSNLCEPLLLLKTLNNVEKDIDQLTLSCGDCYSSNG